MEALRNLFPDIDEVAIGPEPRLGEPSDSNVTFEGVSLGVFLNQLRDQQILDTAMDAMSAGLEGDTTVFEVSRQAAMGGKVSFPIPGNRPLGGCSPSPSPGTALTIGCKLRRGSGAQTSPPSMMNTPCERMEILRHGFEGFVQELKHLTVSTSPACAPLTT